MQNVPIREKAKEMNVKLWQIAEKIGITDATFSRKLRRELPTEEQKGILLLIEEIASEERGV